MPLIAKATTYTRSPVVTQTLQCSLLRHPLRRLPIHSLHFGFHSWRFRWCGVDYGGSPNALTLRCQPGPVKTERCIVLLDHADKFQFADSFRQRVLSQVLGNDASAGRHNRRMAQEFKYAIIFFSRRIGWIEKNELRVHVTRRQPLERAKNIHTEYFSLAEYAKRFQVATDQCRCGLMPFYKYRRARPPAQRLYPHRSRSRVQVYKHRVIDGWTQNVEQRLPQAIARRPQCLAFQAAKRPAPVFSRDHPHGVL